MRVDAADTDFSKYDVIVAGSGLAAYALVRRLNEHGKKKAILLETGEAGFSDSVQSDFTEMYGRGHYDGSYWPLHWVRAMGGTSAVWAGWCGALSERNFRKWPITRSDLDPFYKSAAGYLRRTEPFLTFSSAIAQGLTYRPMSTEEPLRLVQEPELYDALPSVDIALGTTLSELHVKEGRREVEAISIYSLGGSVKRVDLRQGQSVVLAAGGIGNAQILLSSQPENGPAVGNENDQVGRYLMEHPHFIGCAKLITNDAFQIPSCPPDFGEHVDIIEPDNETYRRIGEHDVSLELVPANLNADDPVEALFSRKWGDSAKAYILNARAEMEPEAENRLKLAEGADPAGLKRLRAICHIGTSSFRTVDTFLELLSDRLIASGSGRLRMANEEIMFGVSGGGHIMGTTRMGVSPRTSVVDADCKVHGYQNLFVAGSSVFATGGYANPTLTLMALAARLGEKLGADI